MTYSHPTEDIDKPREKGSFSTPPEGWYLASVREVREKTSSKGDAMMSLHFEDTTTGKSLCWDNLMLAGGGAQFGFSKLKRLGCLRPNGSQMETIPVTEMVGRKAFLFLALDDRNPGYEAKMCPDFNCSEHGARHGYLPESGGESQGRIVLPLLVEWTGNEQMEKIGEAVGKTHTAPSETTPPVAANDESLPF